MLRPCALLAALAVAGSGCLPAPVIQGVGEAAGVVGQAAALGGSPGLAVGAECLRAVCELYTTAGGGAK